MENNAILLGYILPNETKLNLKSPFSEEQNPPESSASDASHRPIFFFLAHLSGSDFMRFIDSTNIVGFPSNIRPQPIEKIVSPTKAVDNEGT